MVGPHRGQTAVLFITLTDKIIVSSVSKLSDTMTPGIFSNFVVNLFRILLKYLRNFKDSRILSTKQAYLDLLKFKYYSKILDYTYLECIETFF